MEIDLDLKSWKTWPEGHFSEDLDYLVDQILQLFSDKNQNLTD